MKLCNKNIDVPSRGLMSAIIPIGNNAICDMELQENELSVLYRRGGWAYYNIHELMNMMKEWAFNNFGISMSSGIIEDGLEWWCGIGVDKTVDFYANTEFEAVTKAAEWILEMDNK